MGYQPQQQQPYFGAHQPYMGQGGQKMGGFDNRSHSPYHAKPYSQNYGNQRSHQQGGYYSNSQERGMGGGYGGNYGEQMMGSNARQGGYQAQMGNRQPYNPNNGQYNKYDYQGRTPGVGQNYGNATYPQTSFNQTQEDETQFNDAILLVTELRGTLPEHLKTDKKNRLNQILHTNLRVQNRVKEYINSLK